MAAKSDLSFAKEGFGDTGALSFGSTSYTGMLLVDRGLGEHEAEENDQHWRTSTEPEERAPSMGSRINKTAGESCCKEVSKSVLKWLAH